MLKPWVKDIEAYVPGATVEGKVKLASNENNYGPSPKVGEAVEKAVAGLGQYPYREPALIEEIARYVGLDKENVLLGNGSDESIDMILKVFQGPVYSFHPTYSEYRIFSQVLGQKYLDSPLLPDFSLGVDGFIEAGKDANIFFICSPNNPTGKTIKKEQLETILSEGKPTVLDEAYVEFADRSLTSLVDEFDNLIVLRTFSKAFGLAGLRVGYIVSDPKNMAFLSKVKPIFSVNSLAIEAALAALGDLEYMRSCVARIKGDREILFAALAKRYKPVRSESNFIFFDVAPNKADLVYEDALDAGFILRKYGRIKGFSGEYMRVTVGTEDQNKAYMQTLKE